MHLMIWGLGGTCEKEEEREKEREEREGEQRGKRKDLTSRIDKFNIEFIIVGTLQNAMFTAYLLKNEQSN